MANETISAEEKTDLPPEADRPAEPVRAKAVLDGRMQSRIGRENRNAGILFAVLGLAAVSFGAVLCALPVFGGGRTIFGVLLIVFGALLLLCGVILLLLLAKSIRTAKRLQLVNEYAFYQDRFTVHTLRGEEDLGTGEFVYTELYKVKEKHGLLQIYASSNIVYPVETAALAPEDLALLRGLLGLPQK